MSGSENLQPGRQSVDQGVTPFMVLLVLALVLGLRVLHMTCALRSPLMFQPGPDEEFYLRFGQAVARGTGGTPEFAFMDPAYGYFLGLIFKLLGTNLFVVYLVQVVLDTVTAFCIFLIGREFGRPRAGLLGALLYGLTCTAIYFSTTLLKATWVANFMTLWVLFSLILLRVRSVSSWLFFGVLCGYGIALRANLVLMAALSSVLLPWLSRVQSQRSIRETALRVGVFCVGLTVPLALLSVRNAQISSTFSPLPNNGGVVLHHLYNPDNPKAALLLPKFVKYGTPSQIWRDYSREAERRAGHALTPHEVDQYWRSEAIGYIASHPVDCSRKRSAQAGRIRCVYRGSEQSFSNAGSPVFSRAEGPALSIRLVVCAGSPGDRIAALSGSSCRPGHCADRRRRCDRRGVLLRG